jgi:hypothetical protein
MQLEACDIPSRFHPANETETDLKLADRHLRVPFRQYQCAGTRVGWESAQQDNDSTNSFSRGTSVYSSDVPGLLVWRSRWITLEIHEAPKGEVLLLLAYFPYFETKGLWDHLAVCLSVSVHLSLSVSIHLSMHRLCLSSCPCIPHP